MKTIDIEKLNQLVSRTDISGNDKVKWLIDFIDGKELHQQKKMYSEEDMRGMYDKSCGLIGLGLLDNQTENNSRFKELLEQFKKK